MISVSFCKCPDGEENNFAVALKLDLIYCWPLRGGVMSENCGRGGHGAQVERGSCGCCTVRREDDFQGEWEQANAPQLLEMRGPVPTAIAEGITLLAEKCSNSAGDIEG